MKKSDLLLIILAVALVVGMILTAILGKERSRHGYGSIPVIVSDLLTKQVCIDRHSFLFRGDTA